MYTANSINNSTLVKVSKSTLPNPAPMVINISYNGRIYPGVQVRQTPDDCFYAIPGALFAKRRRIDNT